MTNYTPLQSSQLLHVHHVLTVDPDHEVAHVPGLKGCRDDDVVPGGQLEPGEDLAVVDVGARGAAVVVVHEVGSLKPLAGSLVASPVQAESYLQHPDLLIPGAPSVFLSQGNDEVTFRVRRMMTGVLGRLVISLENWTNVKIYP